MLPWMFQKEPKKNHVKVDSEDSTDLGFWYVVIFDYMELLICAYLLPTFV